MITYDFGDIVIVSFHYPETNVTKKRPALVILDIGDNDVVLETPAGILGVY